MDLSNHDKFPRFIILFHPFPSFSYSNGNFWGTPHGQTHYIYIYITYIFIYYISYIHRTWSTHANRKSTTRKQNAYSEPCQEVPGASPKKRHPMSRFGLMTDMPYPWRILTVLLYMVCHGSHQYTPFMLAYIPAPWIRHGICEYLLTQTLTVTNVSQFQIDQNCISFFNSPSLAQKIKTPTCCLLKGLKGLKGSSRPSRIKSPKSLQISSCWSCRWTWESTAACASGGASSFATPPPDLQCRQRSQRARCASLHPTVKTMRWTWWTCGKETGKKLAQVPLTKWGIFQSSRNYRGYTVAAYGGKIMSNHVPVKRRIIYPHSMTWEVGGISFGVSKCYGGKVYSPHIGSDYKTQYLQTGKSSREFHPGSSWSAVIHCSVWITFICFCQFLP